MKATFAKLLAVVMVLTMVIPVGAAAPVDPERLKDWPGDQEITNVNDTEVKVGSSMVIVELKQTPWLEYTKVQPAMATQAAYLKTLETVQAEVQAELQGLGVDVFSSYKRVYNGFLANVPTSQRAAVLALSNVKAIHAAPVHNLALENSVPLLGAYEVWQDLGFDGSGVNIAVIDTGIDYTHVAFGGEGKDAYDADDSTTITDTTFPTMKVVGGYDFAGTNYAAGCPAVDPAEGECTSIPAPDADPIDHHGHGTHVASTAAGIMAGEVYSGVAPMANLYALKVFGDIAGSTNVSLDAYEWVAEHNATVSESMKIHVMNMSIGSDFGPAIPDDPESVVLNTLAASGVVIVSSAGNGGQDAYYITGSPSSADSVIAVAASTPDYTGYVEYPTVSVVGSSYMTQTNRPYIPPGFDGDTGLLTTALTETLYAAVTLVPANATMCNTDGFAADAFSGSIALISRGGCAFTDKVNNAASLGAVAAIIHNNAGPFLVSMGGDPVNIPAVFVGQSDGEALVPAHGQEVVISANDDETDGIPVDLPGDWIATFSSKGPRSYDSALKPEVAGPGVSIVAAAVGSGTEGVSMQGTSMASPHIAGVAALMKQAHPDWTTEQIKAAMMNTAVDLVDDTVIPVTGAGRVDALAATSTKVVAVGDDDLVSLSFGVVYDGDSDGDGLKTVVKDVTLYSWETTTKTYTVTASLQPTKDPDYNLAQYYGGIGFDFGADTVEVPAGAPGAPGMVTVPVTMTMATGNFPNWDMWLEMVFGFVNFIDVTMPSESLRLPFFMVPHPYTELEIVGIDTTISALGDVATYAMTQTGAIAPSLWAMATVIEDSEDLTTSQHIDIRYVGVETYGDELSFGINTFGAWSSPQSAIVDFNIYIDADEDGTDDYKLYQYNETQYVCPACDPDDALIILVDDLSTDADDEPENAKRASLSAPYNDYNSSYTEWYVDPTMIGMDMYDDTFSMWVESFGWDEVYTDTTDSALVVVGDVFDFASSSDMLTVTLSNAEAYNAMDVKGVMLVDYNGDPRGAMKDNYQVYNLPVTIGALPDLTIEKVASETVVSLDESIVYTVTLSNNGTVTATNVTMLDTLPHQVTFGSWEMDAPNGTTQMGAEISWTGDVGPGEELVWTFSVDLVSKESLTMYLGKPVMNGASFGYAGGTGADSASTKIMMFEIFLPLVVRNFATP